MDALTVYVATPLNFEKTPLVQNTVVFESLPYHADVLIHYYFHLGVLKVGVPFQGMHRIAELLYQGLRVNFG